VDMKPDYDDLIAMCPNKTQDTGRVHNVDGCTGAPDSLEVWDNNPLAMNYNLYVTNPIWGTVLGDTTANQVLPCNAHDICYQTCGSSQAACDAALGAGVSATCSIGYPFPCQLTDQ